jgi:phage gp36-like protein
VSIVYVTPEDMLDAFGREELVQASNLREVNGGIDDRRIEKACDRASASIYGYLVRRFSEGDIAGLSTNFLETLRDHGLSIARYYLDDGLTDVKEKAKVSFDWLDKFTDPRGAGSGIAGSKPDVTSDTIPSRSIGFQKRTRTWSGDRLRDVGLD